MTWLYIIGAVFIFALIILILFCSQDNTFSTGVFLGILFWIFLSKAVDSWNLLPEAIDVYRGKTELKIYNSNYPSSQDTIVVWKNKKEI